MKKLLYAALVGALMTTYSAVAADFSKKPYGLVYDNAITENVVGKVNIHPVSYTVDGITLVFSQMGTHYAGIKISVSWGYLAVVVGCGLMILRSVWGFGRSLKYLFKGAPAEQDGEEKGGAEQ